MEIKEELKSKLQSQQNKNNKSDACFYSLWKKELKSKLLGDELKDGK